MAAPAVDTVWALSVIPAFVGAEVLVGRLDPVSVDVDTSVDMGVVTEAEAVVVTTVLVVAAVVIPLSGAGDWDGSGQLKMDVPPGNGGGVLVQVLMSTTLPIWDISLVHRGVLQLWDILAG